VLKKRVYICDAVAEESSGPVAIVSGLVAAVIDSCPSSMVTPVGHDAIGTALCAACLVEFSVAAVGGTPAMLETAPTMLGALPTMA